MTAYLNELKKISKDLKDLQARWALVGAMAYSCYAEPRMTRDIDIAVALGAEDDIEELVDQLAQRGYTDKQLLMHLEPTHRLGFRLSVPTNKAYTIPLDILSSFCGIEEEIVSSSNEIELLPSLFIPIASLGHVVAMKVLSQNNADRTRDKVDLLQLVEAVGEEDLRAARKALELITDRGFAHGKELVKDLEELLD